MSRHSQLRVHDILDAIDRIASYVAGMDYERFLTDRKTQDTVAPIWRRLSGEPGCAGLFEI